KNPFEFFSCDTDSIIAHLDVDMTVAMQYRHCHPAAGRSEFQGVLQQVPDDLLQALGIAVDRAGHAVIDQFKSNPALLRLGGKPVDDMTHQRTDIDAAKVEGQLIVDDARNIEQIIDQARLDANVALDDVDALVRRRWQIFEHLQIFGGERDGI